MLKKAGFLLRVSGFSFTGNLLNRLILTCDPAQIDNPYLDASSNGLTSLVEKFKDEAIAGHVTLTHGERSELAEIASNLL